MRSNAYVVECHGIRTDCSLGCPCGNDNNASNTTHIPYKLPFLLVYTLCPWKS